MKSAKQLSDHVAATYRTLRIVLCVIGGLLPCVLWFGGKLWHKVPLQASMSAYYHAYEMNPSTPSISPVSQTPPVAAGMIKAGQGVMRDWFVGALCAIGVLLFAYKGFSAY